MPDTRTSFFETPPTLTNESGRIRRAGFEIEYTGVPLERACEIIEQLYGGRTERTNRFLYAVRNARPGDFEVEVDASLLKEERYRKFLKESGIVDALPDLDPGGKSMAETVEQFAEDVLMSVAKFAIPLEIVTPPLPMNDLDALDELRERLRGERALGSGASVIYAFGLHINPEAAKLNAREFQNHLRAFLLLKDAFQNEAPTDFTREYLSPYIEDFPQTYVRKILAEGYAPDLSQLIRDYLDENPTRNRPLDMLPLFVYTAGADDVTAIRAALPEDEQHLVKGRPTYHYRMPDCRIDDPHWSVAFEWNRWVRVERLARETQRLGELSAEYLRTRGTGWRARLEEWFR